MTKHMELALNFAIQQASVARDCYKDPMVDSDKTYRVEIVYTRPA